MKFTIESKLLNAETDSVKIARFILEMLQNRTFSETGTYDVTKMTPTEILNDQYLTITADDITIGSESTTEYNGNEIWHRDNCMQCVKESSQSFVKEYGASLEELHVVQANNVAGEPVPDKNGKFSWLRCVFDVNGERKISRWVFRDAYSSVAGCRSGCAYSCGTHVRLNAGVRVGVFGSVGN